MIRCSTGGYCSHGDMIKSESRNSTHTHTHRKKTVRQEGRSRSGVWRLAGTSTAMLKSTMDTLVFLCQHTCTMVLPRCGVGLSSEVCEAVMSSSDSASAVESSGHSGEVSKLLLLRNREPADEERGGCSSAAQCQIIHQSNTVWLCSLDFTQWFVIETLMYADNYCTSNGCFDFIWQISCWGVVMLWLTVVGQTAGQNVRRRPVAGFCHLYRCSYVLHPPLHLREWTWVNRKWIECSACPDVQWQCDKLDQWWSECSAKWTEKNKKSATVCSLIGNGREIFFVLSEQEKSNHTKWTLSDC